MSTASTKYILALGGALAIHFVSAADGTTKTAEIAAFTPEMINDPATTLAIFESAELAAERKDALCVEAAVAESFAHASPIILNRLANLQVQGFDPALV